MQRFMYGRQPVTFLLTIYFNDIYSYE